MSVIQNVKLQHVRTSDIYSKEAIFCLLRRIKRTKEHFFSREEKRILIIITGKEKPDHQKKMAIN